MASTINAGNATNGLAIASDNTGILQIKTGTGAGTTAITIDATQNVTLAGTLAAGAMTNSTAVASGYTTGAGGTVTQATSKATAVTLSKPTGQITLNNAALAAATIVSFTLTNTTIAASDVLIINHVSGGTIGAYTFNAQAALGSATINVRNATAGSLSEAIVLNFVVIKGATS